MDIEEKELLLTPTKIVDPRLFTVIGLIGGLIIWVVDAFIDVFIIESDESFIESLIFAEGTELWMRLLVVIVTTSGGYYASRTFRKSLNLNILLYKYQFELEELVRKRTIDLEVKTSQLEKVANLDPLTEIYNRRKFIEFCEIELSRFKRHHHEFSILILDVDNFKLINDNYGHDFGDEVLKQLANIIREGTRNSDYFARWGGEEFIIMCPDSDKEGREIFADKIVKLIADTHFDKIKQITVSLGLTSVNTEDKDIDTIIKRSDIALYKAKSAGKNQYAIED